MSSIPAHKKREKPPQRLAYKPAEAAEQINCSRRRIFELMADGTLASVKVGRLRLIPHTELLKLIEVR
jgi:excisionase family DNA binding protein